MPSGVKTSVTSFVCFYIECHSRALPYLSHVYVYTLLRITVSDISSYFEKETWSGVAPQIYRDNWLPAPTSSSSFGYLMCSSLSVQGVDVNLMSYAILLSLCLVGLFPNDLRGCTHCASSFCHTVLFFTFRVLF